MEKSIVSILMGSDSDLPVMNEAGKVLEEFGIHYELFILSAHRSPEETAQFAKKALDRGIRVIIAGAGGAAHLAGVIASLFPLPVIGVPIKTPTLNGIDSLYSIVQMPPGIPVATVGINGAKNAGILAAEVLAVNNKALQEKLKIYKKNLSKAVADKNKKIKEVGVINYLESLKK